MSIKICSYFFLLSFFACTTKKDKSDIKIDLLNSEVVCVDNVNKQDFLEVYYLPNKIYDSLSKNVLHYKITNVSNKKYFIMLNENFLGTEERDLYNEAIGKKKLIRNSIGFNMYKNGKILDGSSTKIENMCGNDYEFIKLQELDTIIKKFLIKNKLPKKYDLRNIGSENDSLKSYFLQPGETKYFTSVINLPYRNDQKWISNIENKKPNFATISLRNDSVSTNKTISKNVKREIKENGYVLFDGVIYSNRIPVKLITF
ncbi:hypothetical protein [Flavobacterium luteolum]|uniref:hypothetical protein n=1 Tax=Flavobacterium luteolum TaxID=3003259 RepID=UPI00248DFEB3|nr:hypothetical protein [Flavobacterium luteolum]